MVDINLATSIRKQDRGKPQKRKRTRKKLHIGRNLRFKAAAPAQQKFQWKAKSQALQVKDRIPKEEVTAPAFQNLQLKPEGKQFEVNDVLAPESQQLTEEAKAKQPELTVMLRVASLWAAVHSGLPISNHLDTSQRY